MIRKLILSAVLAADAGVSATSVTAAAAPIGRDRDRHDVRFEVQIRLRGHWDLYGTYRNCGGAQRAVRMLERQGKDARIEVERSRR